MKEVVELFRKHELLFKELTPLDLPKFGIKKRVKLFKGIDLQNRYTLLMLTERKSRFLQKDAISFEEIAKKIEDGLDHAFAKKFLFIKAPLCSKAKEWLQKRGYHVIAL